MFYLGIILAGGCGALLRYLLSRAALSMQWTTQWTTLPYGTLLVNVIGSFLIGYLSWTLLHKWQLSAEFQVIVITGFLGGFTTFSAFSYEVVTMLQNGSSLRAIFYIALSVCLSVMMCFLGLFLAKSS